MFVLLSLCVLRCEGMQKSDAVTEDRDKVSTGLTMSLLPK